MSIDLSGFAAVVPAATVERLRSARRVLAVTHEHPDADTLGAALATTLMIEALGGRATPASSDAVPPLYAFMPGIDRFRPDPEPGIEYDLVVVSDFGGLDRIGAIRDRHESLFERVPHLTVDHHKSTGTGGPSDWIDPEAAATCEMAALIAARLGVPLTADDGALATVLMAGIVMDTATFAHPNATPRTLAVSAALVEAGAPLSEISRRLYRTKPDEQLRLFGRVLDRLETMAGGRIVLSTLLDADLAATGSIAAHSEGIIDLLAQSERADVAILLKEQGPAATRVSVRTKPDGVDATTLTATFGGGGHARAAGATIPLPVAEAKPVVVAEAERLLAAIPSR
ncbi:MAG TPA: DHHA1 domain-containing protein [Candidatus Dormibacteraeota bacterium]|nr:DHHA1 domain-containing protein [Candidatus Dormibacteraeota bacterium]